MPGAVNPGAAHDRPVARRRRWRRWLLAVPCLWLVAFAGERLLELCWPYPVAAFAALPRSLAVTAADGSLLRLLPTPAGERVLAGSFANLPAAHATAVRLAEDARFDQHGGVDFLALLRAAASNLRAGRIVSGASTLTMQVVRQVEPRPRSFANKLREVLRARQLERAVGKAAIADAWLQQVPMGGTLRGLPGAARAWFGRPLAELDLVDFAALLAMVPAPSARAPHRHPDRLLGHRNLLLRRLHQGGLLSRAELDAALRRPLGMQADGWPWRLQEGVDAALQATTPASGTLALATALDIELDLRLRAVVAEAELPCDGLAVVVLGRPHGECLAVLGDRQPRPLLDLSQCPRSLGSTLKPFLYALLHQHGGLGDGVRLDDSPLELDGWRPSNFQPGHAGRLDPALALASSNNLTAVRSLQVVGVEAFGRLLRDLGLPASAAPPDLSAALGSGIASPQQLARAYQRLVDAPAQAGLSPASAAYVLAAMRRLPLVPGERAAAVAWKSGTSSGRRDAWCAAITERHVVVVWLGNRGGFGHGDLVGARSANALMARVLACL